jgi:hypothetical protein
MVTRIGKKKIQHEEQHIDVMHPMFDTKQDGRFQIEHIVWILAIIESFVVVVVDAISVATAAAVVVVFSVDAA